MNQPLLISSPQNPKLKAAIGLRDSKDRRKSGLFLIDGLDLIRKAIVGGFEMRSVFIDEQLAERQLRDVLQGRACEVFRVAKGPMEKLQYGDRSLEAIAVAKSPTVDLGALTESLSQSGASPKSIGATSGNAKSSFQSKTVLVLDRMEKPGNLGAALRTADATGVQAVILSDPICDLWNPNAVRSSLGALFTVPIGVGNESDVREWLQHRGSVIYTARVEGSVDYTTVDYGCEHAIVIGNEAQGLQGRWQTGVEQAVRIPMLGEMDSLNASVSTAVLAYESLRQQMTR